MAEYKNPQNEPGADKRMLIALLAVFLVLGLKQFLLPKQAQPPAQQQQSQQQQSQPNPAATPVPSATPVPPKSPAAASRIPLNKIPVKRTDKEEECVLDNGIYHITFTNRGAVIKSWILTEKNPNGSYKYHDNSGKPFDLVNQSVSQQLGYPFSLFTYDKDLQKSIRSEEHTSELQSHSFISYAVFCLKK